MHIIRSDCDISVGGWDGQHITAHIPFVTLAAGHAGFTSFPR